jgi:hypothetical protein
MARDVDKIMLATLAQRRHFAEDGPILQFGYRDAGLLQEQFCDFRNFCAGILETRQVRRDGAPNAAEFAMSGVGRCAQASNMPMPWTVERCSLAQHAATARQCREEYLFEFRARR